MVRLIGIILNAIAFFSERKAAALAFRIFCYPGRAKMNDSQKQFLTRGLKFYFDFGPNRIARYEWGYGNKIIVLVHGWKSHTARWKPLIESLDPSVYKIIAVDAPSQGFSSGAQLNIPKYGEVLNHILLPHRKIHAVIGHSLGAMAVLHTFYEYDLPYPQKVILLATASRLTEFMKGFQKMTGFKKELIEAMDLVIKKKFGVGMAYFDILKYAQGIRLTSLIIHDTSDRISSYKHAVELSMKLEGSQLILTEGLNHKLKGEYVQGLIHEFMHKKSGTGVSSSAKDLMGYVKV